MFMLHPELLQLYRKANGLGLFCVLRKLSGLDYFIPCRQLNIFGIPLTFTRDRLEPYNISIEDLSRLPGTPKNWLKFGVYNELRDGALLNEYDLFVNVEDYSTYSSPREGKQMRIVKKWNSIDACLCDLFEQLSK